MGIESVAGYRKIIEACDCVDYVTQDFAVRLLAEVEELRYLFTGLLKSVEEKR